METKKELIANDIKKVNDLIGKTPTYEQYHELGVFSKRAICEEYGSWGNATFESTGKRLANPRCSLPELACLFCGKKFLSTFHGRKYCSISCSNLHNPRKRKSTKQKLCKVCSKAISLRNSFCHECLSAGKHLRGGMNLAEKTLADIVYKSGPNKYGVVRCHARTITRTRPQVCERCPYTKHVETCHIKEISSFSLDALVSVINAPDNLLLLCANCHWELDHPEVNGGPDRI